MHGRLEADLREADVGVGIDDYDKNALYEIPKELIEILFLNHWLIYCIGKGTALFSRQGSGYSTGSTVGPALCFISSVHDLSKLSALSCLHSQTDHLFQPVSYGAEGQ